MHYHRFTGEIRRFLGLIIFCAREFVNTSNGSRAWEFQEECRRQMTYQGPDKRDRIGKFRAELVGRDLDFSTIDIVMIHFVAKKTFIYMKSKKCLDKCPELSEIFKNRRIYTKQKITFIIEENLTKKILQPVSKKFKKIRYAVPLPEKNEEDEVLFPYYRIFHHKREELLQEAANFEGGKGFVLNTDNFKKILLIYQKSLMVNIPIVLMGESGCGKTYLIKFLAEVLLQKVKFKVIS